jgi:superfamily II DNA or RNA helicase
MDWTVSKVTYEERSPEQRSQIFQDFSTGAIDAMASIRVLDEGVDIPDCKRAFILASQRSERQGIQRRGRILRKSALKESAELFDFIITGPRSEEKFLRNLYDKELRRAALFSSDAINRDECFRMIEQTR